MELQFDINKIEELSKKHNLKLLILHGSRAKGFASEKSDIDVGILCKDKIDPKRYMSILSDFEDVFGDKFDPAFLNNAEPMIIYHVALSGKVLFEDIKGSFANFKTQAIARYLDTKKFRDLEKVYIKRVIGVKT